MQHRKKEHKSSVAPCRKFSVGECPYNDDKCWWNHTDKGNLSENVQCFICSKTYKSKGEMMKHRKKEHRSVVKFCDKFQEGKCGFQDDFCWFRHDEKEEIKRKIDEQMDIGNESENEESKSCESVFYETQRKLKPPIKRKQ